MPAGDEKSAKLLSVTRTEGVEGQKEGQGKISEKAVRPSAVHQSVAGCGLRQPTPKSTIHYPREMNISVGSDINSNGK